MAGRVGGALMDGAGSGAVPEVETVKEEAVPGRGTLATPFVTNARLGSSPGMVLGSTTLAAS